LNFSLHHFYLLSQQWIAAKLKHKERLTNSIRKQRERETVRMVKLKA